MIMLDAVADILKRRQSQGWLVGGSVRDRMLGRSSPDLDIVVADDAAAVAKQVAAALRVPWFELSERHVAYRVLGAGGRIDVAAVRGNSILDDLAERDFTVNAMAVPVEAGSWESSLEEESLLDPFGGAAHLREKRLVAVSEHIFADDSLRLMRAPRFCHTLGFELADDLASSIRDQAPDLTDAATERVVIEVCLTLAVGRSAAAVELWHELGLLRALLPGKGPRESDGARGPGAGGMGTGELSQMLSLLTALDDLLERPGKWFPDTGDLLARRWEEPVDGMIERPVALRLAGLLHGLTTGESQSMGRRLKLSRPMLSFLTTLSRPLVTLVPALTAPTREAVLFLWGSAPWEPEAIAVAAAATACAGRDGDQHLSPEEGRLGAVRRLMSLWGERVLEGVPQPPLNGETLMGELDLESGPAVGKALREVRLAWESGETTTAGEAMAVARRALSPERG
jgi:hypothetical protein